MAKRNASAIITVLGMTVLLSVIVLGWWRSISMTCDIVNERQCYYKDYYAADRVRAYGVELAKMHFDDLLRVLTKSERFEVPFIVQGAILEFDVPKENKERMLTVKAQVGQSKPLFSYIKKRYAYDPKTKKKKHYYLVQPCLFGVAV